MVYTHALVSRPRPQLDELAGWLRSANVEPVPMPAFRFEAVGEPVRADADWRAAGSRLLLFTSPRAVEFGLPVIEEPMLRESRMASIGPATTRAVTEAGHDCLQAPGPDYVSEALLAHLDDVLEPGAAIIIAAPGGRDALRRGLAERGWKVRVAPVYRRLLQDPEADAGSRLERAERVVSFWTSGAALEHILDQLPDEALRRVRSGTAVVVSERLAALARKRGMGEVVVAKGPANEDLLEAFHLLGG